jgi:hypothetical protein
LARETGVDHSTVARIWKHDGIKPHRLETFKFSADPELGAKVTDVIGLYMSPPDNAVVLSVDEKSQVQALDRTQPMLPLRPGLAARRTHDYKRNGTTTLFAALEVAAGKVVDAGYPRHRHQEFLKFLTQVAKAYARVKLHIVCDHYATHKHENVQTWLSATSGSRCLSRRLRDRDESGGGILLDYHPSGDSSWQLRVGD